MYFHEYLSPYYMCPNCTQCLELVGLSLSRRANHTKV